MTVKPILWTYKQHVNGTYNVKIYVRKNGKKKYVTTDISVKEDQWDKRKLEVRNHPMKSHYNAEITKKKMEIERRLFSGESLKTLNRPEQEEKQGGSLLTFIRTYIQEVKNGRHEIKLSTCKNYQSCLTKLEAYTTYKNLGDLTFDDINIGFYHEFSDYLVKHHNCRRPGAGQHIKNLKKFMNEALARKLHNNKEFENFKVYKKSMSNKIWLTEEEISRLEVLDLSSQPALERERDRFLVSFYFLMRYSDSVRISKEWIFTRNGKRYLKYDSKKTGNAVILPIKPKAWKLLQKYDFKLSGDTNQEANRKLKIIGAMAGIVDVVSEGDREGPKCSFIATHTARRSAATQMYLQGVSIKMIADLGGWKDFDNLKLYLRSSMLEAAVTAQDLEFFQ